MDIRSLTLLGIKLIGLFFLITAFSLLLQNLFVFPLTGNGGVEGTMGTLFPPAVLIMPPIIYAFDGLVLLLLSGKIANRLIAISEEKTPSGPVTVYNLLSIGIRLISLYAIFNALYTIIYYWSRVYVFYVGTHPPEMVPDDKASFLAAGAQLAVAAACWAYSDKIVSITRKIARD